MRKARALFVVVKDYGHDEATGHAALAHRITSKLSDFRALGYRIIGILTGAQVPDDTDRPLTLDFEFDELHCEQEVTTKGFPDVAWSSAKRYSLNVRGSLLCSADPLHVRWANDAGLARFETPESLFG